MIKPLEPQVTALWAYAAAAAIRLAPIQKPTPLVILHTAAVKPEQTLVILESSNVFTPAGFSFTAALQEDCLSTFCLSNRKPLKS